MSDPDSSYNQRLALTREQAANAEADWDVASVAISDFCLRNKMTWSEFSRCVWSEACKLRRTHEEAKRRALELRWKVEALEEQVRQREERQERKPGFSG